MTEGEVILYLTTAGRYCLLSLISACAYDYGRSEGKGRFEKPSLLGGVVTATVFTGATWVVGYFTGILFVLYWTERGPLYHRLFGVLSATFFAAYLGFLMGRSDWIKADQAKKREEREKILNNMK